MPQEPLSPSSVRLGEAFAQLDAPWTPRIVGALNGQHLKVALFQDAFVWHAHEHEDEAFLVLEGHVTIELRDGALELGPGDVGIVPRGVEHRPVSPGGARVLLFEPAGTVNTGDQPGEATVEPEWL